MFFWRELIIKIICALICISMGCNTSKPIQIDDISNLKKIDLSSYQKTTIDGINYYLLPFEQDYTVNLFLILKLISTGIKNVIG